MKKKDIYLANAANVALFVLAVFAIVVFTIILTSPGS